MVIQPYQESLKYLSFYVSYTISICFIIILPADPTANSLVCSLQWVYSKFSSTVNNNNDRLTAFDPGQPG